MSFPYATPRAFRAAPKDRFSALLKADPRLSIDELQRQFAYDRVLARCFAGTDSAGWVLKGAGALLARLEGIARHSKDIDLSYTQRAASTDRAVEAFLDAIDRIAGSTLRAALLTGAAHRGLTLPSRFEVPDIEAWRPGYARRANDVPGQVPNFDEAIDLAQRLLDPVLAGPVAAVWNPTTGQWDT